MTQTSLAASDAGTETVSCPCGSRQPPRTLIQARDEGSGTLFTYMVCPDCTLERLSPRPTLEHIGAYYPAHYVPHVSLAPQGASDRFKRLIYDVHWATNSEVPANIAAFRQSLRVALWPFRYRSILSFPPPPLRLVFEFGAARATDLLAFKAAGWQVEGCEPSAQACALAATQGITLQNTSAEAAVLQDNAYSCILFNNVFEHVHDPAAVLRKCHRALLPGGLLMLIVPNHASWTSRLFGAAWPGYDAPRHLWGWSPPAVQKPLAEAGFVLDAIRHQATGPWLWRSTLDMRHAPGTPSRLRLWLSRHAAALGVPLSVVAAASGHGDFMRVMAHKAD